jgi:DNA segregation ATPase FtsK/SpoIIIE-like protein
MEKGRLNREIWGVVIFLTALLIAISLLSFDVRDRSFNSPSGIVDTHNWGGFLGAYLADLLLQGFGLSSYLFPVFGAVIAFRLFKAQYKRHPDQQSSWPDDFFSIAIAISIFIDSENAR